MSKTKSIFDPTRANLGEIATDLSQKAPETLSPIEQMWVNLKKYEENVLLALQRGKKDFPYQDFYVHVEVKKEPLLKNVIRHYFFSRLTCPTPFFDQIVYKYMVKDDRLEFLWVMPAKDIAENLRDNALLVPKEEKELLDFVLDYYDGTLLMVCKKLNGEKEHTVLLDN